MESASISNPPAKEKISSYSVTEELLNKISKVNPKLKLFITITGERAQSAARNSDQRKELLGELDGIPIAIKDNFFIKGVRCTAGSKILSDFVPDFDAPAVEKLEQAGAVILGTTNLHEFASGVTTANPYYGFARNPWKIDRICGGSSGGSAGAVAAGLCYAALGTDTSGSVRIPASLCGVVGLKPTFGLVSTRGTIPLSFSLDHVGILARNCVDAAIILDIIACYDPQDPVSVKSSKPNAYKEETINESGRMHKIGIPKKFFLDILDEEVLSAFEQSTNQFRSLGYELSQVDIPDVENCESIWAPIRFSEASSYHYNWTQTRRSDYSDEILRKLDRGKDYSAIQYLLAKKEAREFRKKMVEAMDGFDAFISPTTTIPAPKIGEEKVVIGSKELEVYSALVRLTLPYNVSGLPALSVPMGLSREGLPLGLQIAGRPFEESTILGIGSSYEEKFPKIGLAQV
ncbi:MAG: amidase [Nitrososphaerales archaeon]